MKYAIAFFVPDEDQATYTKHQRQIVVVGTLIHEMIVEGDPDTESDVVKTLNRYDTVRLTEEQQSEHTTQFFDLDTIPARPGALVGKKHCSRTGARDETIIDCKTRESA